eukprot:TRINITY_DN9744_c0_g1_i5.p1 TRINITY_DN9744_c0_g1~~TRINITY_DN9744_c0_g1_i5.p1  ORF type:complete len:143 (-),score=36.62 TRINITY_DN9744_c0_g1_i5:308-736(-)
MMKEQSISSSLENNYSLDVLILSENEITDEGVITLSGGLALNNNLKSLFLINNELTNSGSEKIAAALKTNASLTELNLSGCLKGVIDLGCYGRALQTNSSLKIQCLISNEPVVFHGFSKFTSSLKGNSALREIKIRDDTTPN